MKVRTFRNTEINVPKSIEVFVPINDELGLPNLIEIENYDVITNRFTLIDREDIQNNLEARKAILDKVPGKEIFYLARFEGQNIFEKAIKC
jgi:hypothetical protein